MIFAEALEPRRVLSAAVPHLLSIERASPAGAATNASVVTFTVTFDEPVTGVTAANFQWTASTGVSVAPAFALAPASGLSATYSVTASNISGNGSLGLNLVDDGGIVDADGNPLAGNRVLGAALFRAATNEAVGPYPRSVIAGDFNGDGKADLAVANYDLYGDSHTISILLGRDDGTFAAAVNYDAGVAPNGLAAGDFNGDGTTDLAVASFDGNAISILSGKGEGTFQAAVSYVSGSAPAAVTVGDFNGDGKADLAVANNDSNDVSILLGNGDGTFQTAVKYGVGPNPDSVAVGDFNGDGKLDLAEANYSSGNIGILLGYGNGTFHDVVYYSAMGAPGSVTVGDFNGDGKTDLAVALYGSDYSFPPRDTNNVSILLGHGDGTFQAAVRYPTAERSVTVTAGDFNGDGKADLVVANHGHYGDGHTVSVLLGHGDGTFQATVSYEVGPTPTAVTVGDFNGDGRADLAVANYTSHNVSVLLGYGDGTFQTTTDLVVGNDSGPTTAGDFNGDGKLDLAVTHSTYDASDITILLGDGNGTFQEAGHYAGGNGPGSVTVGDFNGDGKADLVVANSYVDDNVGVLLGNGDGTFQAAVNYAVGNGPDSVAVGDFNGDGRTDLAVANYNSGNVSILLGLGDGTFAAAVNYTVWASPLAINVGDFNGDGRIDLALANQRDLDGNVTILLGRGDGTFADAVHYLAVDTPYSLTVGDFNGDSRLDLAAAVAGDELDGKVCILLGRGDGTFAAAVEYAVGTGTGPGSVMLGDFNRDGRVDLAVANNDSNDVSILLGNGDGTFQAALSYVVGVHPGFVTTSDVDGDGLVDLVMRAGEDIAILLARNTYVSETYTIDMTPPASQVSALPQSVSSSDFTVAWAGSDNPNGSGLASYDVYVSENGGAFTLWQSATTDTSATFTGANMHTYGFYSVATDNVGNVESGKPSADAATTVRLPSPDLSVTFGDPKPAYGTYVPGDKITLPITVANYSAVTAQATKAVPVVIEVRASTDNIFDGSDTLLATLYLTSPLAAGKAAKLSASFVTPLGLDPGSYYLVTEVDTTAVVTETNESNNTAATASALTAAWQFGNVAGRSGAATLAFNDTDGTLVTLKLTGPGTGTLTQTVDGWDISVVNTTLASNLTITTTKSKTTGDDGRFTLHDLTVGDVHDSSDHTALGKLIAATTDIAGDVWLSGPATQITLGDWLGDHDLFVGAPTDGDPVVTITLGNVTDLQLESQIRINALTVKRWMDSSASPNDSITAPSLGTLTSQGDFAARVLLSEADGGSSKTPTLNTVNIQGTVHSGYWDIAAGHGAINTVQAKRWLAGDIHAASLNQLTISGQTSINAYAGDFLAELDLTGEGVTAHKPTLGSAMINGSLVCYLWDIEGAVGSLTVTGVVGGNDQEFSLFNVTDLGTLALGDVVRGSVEIAGDLKNLTARRWQAGTLQANTLGTLKVTGQGGVGGFAGDFLVNLTLHGEEVAGNKNVLGSATINGAVNQTWRIEGQMGSLTVNGSVGWDDRAFVLQDVADVSSLTFGDVAEGSIFANGNIKNLTAKRWQVGAIYANTLGTLVVTGQSGPGGFAGDFLANMSLYGQDASSNKLVLGAANIAGSMLDSQWRINGAVGSVTINGALGANETVVILQDITNINSLVLGDVAGIWVNVSGKIASLTARRWQNGSINANTLDSFKVTGQSGAGGYAGDCRMDLWLGGDGVATSHNVLGSADIQGQWSTIGGWSVNGQVGSITARSATGCWFYCTRLGAFKLTDAAATNDLTIVADALNTFTVTGSLRDSQFYLAQAPEVEVDKALGSFTVTGSVTHTAVWSGRNVGAVKAGIFDHVLFFAGVQDEVTGRPMTADDFVDPVAANLPTIASLTLTGLKGQVSGPVLIASDIAAGKIGTISLPTRADAVITSNNGDRFGFAVRLPVKKYTGPASLDDYTSGADALVS